MSRRFLSLVCVLIAVGLAGSLVGQAPAERGPRLVLVSAAGRRALPTIQAGDREMVSVDDLAAAFQLAVREDALAGGLTLTYKGKAIVLTPDQAVASVAGRLVSLPSAVVHDNRRWLVPVEFISRALALIYDARLEYRRASRMVILGDIRVPRVVGREEHLGNQARLIFEVSGRVSPTVVQETGRLLVRFDAEAIDATLPATPLPGLVEGVQVAEPATIAIALGSRYASFRASTLPVMAGGGVSGRGASTEGSTQVVIDILAAGAEAAPAAPAPATEAPPPSPSAPLALTPAAPSIRTVVIDPGHGGTEAGARAADGTLEKDVSLSLARRLKGTLEGRLGLRVLLTRDGDQDVPADDRAALANNNKADLFLSLHANASWRGSVSGAQVYHLNAGPDGVEARSPGYLLPTVGGGAREIDVIRWELAQVRHVQESATFADLVRAELGARVPMNARAVEPAPLRVLVGANMPAVLVEVGFLSNAEQATQLKSPEFQNLIVQALFDAIVRFREAVERGAVRRAAAPAAEPARGNNQW